LAESDELSIGEMVQRSGVTEGTLRMWERRHGFPNPTRLASGHRRYSEDDLETVRRIVSARASGLTLPVAIEQARGPASAPPSLFAWTRQAHPELEVQHLSWQAMLALSHAIEDECLARAERPLLFASFQRERCYRDQEARWLQLAATARLACVFADFPEPCLPPVGPAEICVAPDSPLVREWAIVCDAPGYGVCLTGWELPPGEPPSTRERRFETLWSVEPEVVRGAARVCAGIARFQLPEPPAAAREQLEQAPSQPTWQQLRLAAAITNRAFAHMPETPARDASRVERSRSASGA
jgi:MerR family transcriptional regulator, light-induced transcriptional regulator